MGPLGAPPRCRGPRGARRGEGHDSGLALLVALGLVTTIAAAYWSLAYRDWRRAASPALLVLAPLVVVWLVVRAGLVVVLVAVGVLLALALAAGRAALASQVDSAGMPEYVVRRQRRPFVVMNPRSGSGRVGRSGLREKAEELGAEVVLLDGPEVVDVAQLARKAVARGCRPARRGRGRRHPGHRRGGRRRAPAALHGHRGRRAQPLRARPRTGPRRSHERTGRAEAGRSPRPRPVWSWVALWRLATSRRHGAPAYRRYRTPPPGLIPGHSSERGSAPRRIT